MAQHGLHTVQKKTLPVLKEFYPPPTPAMWTAHRWRKS
jgi:hypothetical protein